MTLKPIIILLFPVIFASCNAAEMDRICEPQIDRKFNIVYNAHFSGELFFENTCSDTAFILRTDLPIDTVPPQNSVSFSLLRDEQYMVAVNCSDSTHTYTYSNKCP